MRGIHAYQTMLDSALPWIRTAASGLRQGSPNQSSRKKKSSADAALAGAPCASARTGPNAPAATETPSAAAVP
jgi:hypothetical protein